MEAEQAEKLQKIRDAKEAQRKKQVRWTYVEYKIKLDEVNEFQKDFLDGQHRRDQDHLTLRTHIAMDGLDLKHEAKLGHLRQSLNAKITDREEEWDRDWQDRVAQEQITEARYETQLEEWAKNVNDGVQRKERLLKAQRSKFENGQDAYVRRRDDELERLRWVLDEEVSIERELMNAKKARIEESFKAQELELQVKVRSELRWFELVILERARLLDKSQEVELADELIDDADDRWNTLIVKEEAAELGLSRFRSAIQCAKG